MRHPEGASHCLGINTEVTEAHASHLLSVLSCDESVCSCPATKGVYVQHLALKRLNLFCWVWVGNILCE